MTDRGPGGNEPSMIRAKMDEGLTFDQALAEVEQLHAFRCPGWWKDLNRPLYNGEPEKKPAAPAKK